MRSVANPVRLDSLPTGLVAPLFHGARSCPWPSTGCCYELPLDGSDLGSLGQVA